MADFSGGQVVWILDADTGKFTNALRGAKAQAEDLGESAEQAGQRGSKGFDLLGKTLGVIKGAALAGTAAAIGLIATNIDDAVKRIDIMKNFPKVMSNLGISADDSGTAMKKLDTGLQGLPTRLQDAALAVQKLTSANGDIEKSTDVFLALNNAILAGGADAQIQSSALDQISQSFAKGRPDMIEWSSLLTAMPAQLKQVAQAMDFKSADALGEALRTGRVSMDDFGKALVQLNKKGLKGFPSLAEQAKNATGGIGTSMSLMNSAITRGITSILDAIGQANISAIFVGIGKAMEVGLTFLSDHADIIGQIALVITTLFLPALIQLGIQTVKNVGLYIAQTILAGTQTLIAGAKMAAGWLLAMGPIGLIVAAVIAAVALIILNWDKVLSFLQTVGETFNNLFVKIKEFGAKAISTVGSFVARFINWYVRLQIRIISTVANIVSRVVSFFVSLGSRVIGSVAGFVGAYIGFWVNLVGRVVGIVSGFVGRITSFFGSLGSRILGAVGNFGSLLFSAGADLINGLVGGVQSAVGGLLSTVGDIANNAANTFKSALGIKSPSRVFAGFGENIVEGLNQGIEGAGSPSVSVLANDVIGAGENLSARATTAGGTTTGAGVVINLNMDGIMTRSKGDMREVAKQMLEAVNEELRAKGVAEIGGGNLSGQITRSAA